MTGSENNSGYDFKRFSVLFVDDEQQARKYFRMALAPEMEVLTAASPEEADGLINEHAAKIGIVVSDQRMPGEGGAAFLGRVRKRAPQTIRILTTAYADMAAAIEAVNTGAIYKYIVKPWEINDLRVTIRRAMEYRILRQERDLLVQEKLSTLQHLLIADRVRSLAVLARGLSHHVRNALTALETYVHIAKNELERAPTQPDAKPEFWRSIWDDAELVNRQLLKVVEMVSDATVQESYRFEDTLELSELIEAAQTGAELGSPEFKIVGQATPGALRCDRVLMERLFSILFYHMKRVTPKAAGIELEYLPDTELWQKPAKALRLRTHGQWDRTAVTTLFTPFSLTPDAPREVRPDLLAAFFIVYHHGGTINVRTEGPDGPGFELALPLDPTAIARPDVEEGLLERLFFHTEEWERMERGG